MVTNFTKSLNVKQESLTDDVSMEQQFKSYSSDLLASENQLAADDTFTVDGKRYGVSQVESIHWHGGVSWQSWVLASVWHVKLSYGRSLNVVPTKLDHDSWDTLSSLAFPE